MKGDKVKGFFYPGNPVSVEPYYGLVEVLMTATFVLFILSLRSIEIPSVFPYAITFDA